MEQMCAHGTLNRRGSPPLLIPHILNSHNEVSNLRDGVHLLGDSLLGVETKPGWRTPHQSLLIPWQQGKERVTPFPPFHPQHLTSIPAQRVVHVHPRNPSQRGRPEIYSASSAEATAPPSLSRERVSPLPFDRFARGDSLMGLWLWEPPSSSPTPPLTGVNWFTNPAIRLAYAPLSFLCDFLVYHPLPGC